MVSPRKSPRRLSVPQDARDAREAEVRERIASIFDCPCDVLPDGPAQLCLVALAHWFDVRVYASGGELTGTWCVWLEPLADVRPGHDGRVTVEEWRRDYVRLLAEMGYGEASTPAEGEGKS